MHRKLTLIPAGGGRQAGQYPLGRQTEIWSSQVTCQAASEWQSWRSSQWLPVGQRGLFFCPVLPRGPVGGGWGVSQPHTSLSSSPSLSQDPGLRSLHPASHPLLGTLVVCREAPPLAKPDWGFCVWSGPWLREGVGYRHLLWPGGWKTGGTCGLGAWRSSLRLPNASISY